MARVKTPYLKFKPKEINELTWRIIVEAWENGLSHREVSLRLRKTENATYLTAKELQEMTIKYPEVGELFSALQLELNMAAKLAVAESVKDGDVKTAKWYLERRAPEEFSTKSSVQFENAVIEVTVKDKEEALKQMIEKFESDAK